ncbi:MAG: hypothetical protein J7L69_04275 [Desulfobulbaceae bacterium]|nr:hypothetical protein [Desulfobulbaceae bacterium]
MMIGLIWFLKFGAESIPSWNETPSDVRIQPMFSILPFNYANMGLVADFRFTEMAALGLRMFQSEVVMV